MTEAGSGIDKRLERLIRVLTKRGRRGFLVLGPLPTPVGRARKRPAVRDGETP